MTRTELLQTEQEHQKRAFELYRSLGAKRSYVRVAKQIGVSPSTVKLWSRSFGWRERLEEHEAEQARQLADRALHRESADDERNLKIVQAALVRLAKGIAEGRVKLQMGDLDRLVRLEEHLREQLGVGEYTDYSKLTDEQLLAQLREMHAELGKEIKQLENGSPDQAKEGQADDED